MIPKAVAASLVAKGFMTKKPGGHVLSDAGRSWLVENGYVWVPKT
ncbi:MAG: hypothetical protein ABJA61_01425 [Caldimonas sp.]